MSRRKKWEPKSIHSEFSRGTGSDLAVGARQADLSAGERKYLRVTGLPSRDVSRLIHEMKPDFKEHPESLKDPAYN